MSYYVRTGVEASGATRGDDLFSANSFKKFNSNYMHSFKLFLDLAGKSGAERA